MSLYTVTIDTSKGKLIAHFANQEKARQYELEVKRRMPDANVRTDGGYTIHRTTASAIDTFKSFVG